MKTRRSVHLSDRHMEFLRQEAARMQITVAELLRRIIDRYMEQKEGV